jgi:putative ABC transport system permease protein
MAGLLHDLRFGFRLLLRSPKFTFAALLALVIGIGANTAVYSIFYAQIVADFPYPHPEQLVVLWSRDAGHKRSISAGDFLDWRRESKVFQILGAVRSATFNLSLGDKPQQVQGDYLTPGFLDKLIGDRPFMGRYFSEEEGTLGKDHVVIITHKLWQSYFSGDPHIIGKHIHLNGQLYTVIGVQPPGQPDRLVRQIVLPFVFPPDVNSHDFHYFVVLGRLKPGVTIAQANADMDVVARHLSGEYPKSNKGWGISVEPLKNDFLDPSVRGGLWVLMGAVGFVLMIACVNVANLLMARGATRQREVAIRASVGASRARIFTQFLLESLALASVGGALGLALAWGLLKVLLAMMPPNMLLSEADVRLSLPVLLFTISATVLAGVLFGCAPAWQATRLDLNEILKEGGRSLVFGRSLLRRSLVVIEFALALTLLAGGGIALHSLWNLAHADVGFPTDHLLTCALPVPDGQLRGVQQVDTFYRQILDKVQSLPGIESASVATDTPPYGAGMGLPFQIAGMQSVNNPAEQPGTQFGAVTPMFFETYGIRIDKGRAFTEQDREGTLPVAVVNETFAKKYFSGVDPLTQRLRVAEIVPGVAKLGTPIDWQIVGVYRDLPDRGLQEEIFPEMLVPFAQSPWPQAVIAVRSRIEPEILTKSIATVVQSIDPNLPLAFVKTMDQLLADSRTEDRFRAVLFGVFAAIALVLAALGIYGVMSFAVAQRTHEIGLRMALGAGQDGVLSLVMREGMSLALAGLALGLCGAISVGRVMRGMWYQVGTIDATAFSGVSLVLLASALLACYIPARRAAKVDPLVALRYE